MKITKIETIHFDFIPREQWERHNPSSRQALPNNLWVRIHTEAGLVGLGETYYAPRAVAAIIHDVYSGLLLGRDPLDIENVWANLFSLANFCGFAGAEMRAISAIDFALWDLAGQHAGLPVYSLLGGRNRDRIRVYNTCVGYGKHDDLRAWREGRAGELAGDLLAQGISAMKIWPFDQFGATLAGPDAERQPVNIWGGETAAGILAHSLGADELRQGVAVVEEIRKAVGDRMEIAIEGHARWNLPTAVRIARALEPLDILWLEEVMPPDNTDAYVRLKQSSAVPICQSERAFSRFGFRSYIEKNAADIIMPDIAWCGGLTEGRKIASHADTYYLPVATHDCIGPVSLIAAVHLMLHIPNAMIAETVRSYWDGGWYNDVITTPIQVREGYLALDASPGLGVKLRDDLPRRPGAQVATSSL